jgi:hypothetical protein
MGAHAAMWCRVIREAKRLGFITTLSGRKRFFTSAERGAKVLFLL